MYRFNIVHVPGKSKKMKVADTTSRNPVGEISETEACEAAALVFAQTLADGITSVD